MNISQCLNPGCLHKNRPGNPSCERCGTKLLLGDRYRAIGYIGKGSFGMTFLAVDEHRLDTPCVIKQFLPRQEGGTELQKAVQLFKQEAIRLRDLGKHPQIPDLEAFFEQEKRLYLIQEFIDGQDLLKEVHKRGKFTEQDIRQILMELLPIIQFIHEHQVIHRDIKPSNIIRRRDGSLVLIDFGVAKQQLNAAPTGDATITGTLGYAAPEQLLGKVLPASDLYALGSTCVRLVTGCVPKQNTADDLYDPIDMEWRWREKVALSTNLGRVLDKMLQHKVSNRFQSAAETLAALNTRQVNTYIETPVSTTVTPSLPVSTPRNFVEPSQPQEYQQKTSRVSRYGIRSSQPSFPLASDIGYDYTKLKDLLLAHNYKQADEETYRILLSVTDRKNQGWLTTQDIDDFPCTDLQTIDKLWVEYSKGRFGFSVQKKIYENLGGTNIQNKKVWLAFCESVGWRLGSKWLRYSDLNFALNAPAGHLPCCDPPTDLMGGMIQFEMNCNFVVARTIGSISQRLSFCNN